MGWLDGRVALVTGGGSGIGRAVVQRYIEEGARVAVLEKVSDRLDQLKSDFGESVFPIQGDVTKLEDNQRAADDTARAFGKLDIFVGNAGVVDGFVSLVDIPNERLNDAFDEQFAVNVKGPFFGAKATIPHLMESEGCMVFTASGAGFQSAGGGSLYTATKHAVVGLIRQLAAELAPKIRVNGVAPGGTMTDLRGLESLGQHQESSFASPGAADRIAANSPLQMAIEPQDLAATYLLLASKENARAITGTIVGVDTGTLLRPWTRR
jgi:NAD(P)-dependent dehydrogenase (short-subunit alcohol dehydrogenase family)